MIVIAIFLLVAWSSPARAAEPLDQLIGNVKSV